MPASAGLPDSNGAPGKAVSGKAQGGTFVALFQAEAALAGYRLVSPETTVGVGAIPGAADRVGLSGHKDGGKTEPAVEASSLAALKAEGVRADASAEPGSGAAPPAAAKTALVVLKPGAAGARVPVPAISGPMTAATANPALQTSSGASVKLARVDLTVSAKIELSQIRPTAGADGHATAALKPKEAVRVTAGSKKDQRTGKGSAAIPPATAVGLHLPGTADIASFAPNSPVVAMVGKGGPSASLRPPLSPGAPATRPVASSAPAPTSESGGKAATPATAAASDKTVTLQEESALTSDAPHSSVAAHIEALRSEHSITGRGAGNHAGGAAGAVSWGQTVSASLPQDAHALESRQTMPPPAPWSAVPNPIAVSAGTANPVLASPFDRIDQGHSPIVLHAGSQHVEVGIHDPQLGWVEISAQGNAGHVDARLIAASGQSHAALAAQLPAIAQYLQEREVRVGSLGVHPPGVQTGTSGGQPGGQSGTHTGAGGGGAQHSYRDNSGGGAKEIAAAPMLRSSGPGLSRGPESGAPGPVSYISVRA